MLLGKLEIILSVCEKTIFVMNINYK